MIRGTLCYLDKLIIDVDCFIEINYAYLIILKLNQIIRECLIIIVKIYAVMQTFN